VTVGRRLELKKIGDVLIKAQSDINNMSSIQVLKEKHRANRNEKKNLIKQKSDLEDKERKCGQFSVEKLRAQIDKKTAEKEIHDHEMLRISTEMSLTEIAIDKIDKTLSKISTPDNIISNLQLQVSVCESLKYVFNTYAGRVVRYKRSSLEKSVNDIYSRTAHIPKGIRKVKIRDDYTFEIVANKKKVLLLRRQSPGGKEVVAFSFIMGLNRYADKNVPIILDTFTGHLDKEHRINIADEVANYDRGQVILLVHEADLAFGIKKTLSGSIAQEYQINHDYGTRISTIQEKGRA